MIPQSEFVLLDGDGSPVRITISAAVYLQDGDTLRITGWKFAGMSFDIIKVDETTEPISLLVTPKRSPA